MLAAADKDEVGALVCFRSALAAWEQTPGSQLEQAPCRARIGELLIEMRRRKEGVDQARKALDLFTRFGGTPQDQAACRALIGPVILGQGPVESASVPDLGEHDIEIGTLMTAAVELEKQGRPEDSLEKDRRTLALLEECKRTTQLQAAVRQAMGRTLVSMGSLEEAVAEFRKVQDLLSGQAGTELDRLETASHLSTAWGELGRPEEAIRENYALLAIQGELPGMEKEIAVAHLNIGYSLLSMGRHEQAMAEFGKALDLATRFRRTVGDYVLGMARITRGQGLLRMDRPDAAMEEFAQARPVLAGMEGSKCSLAMCQMMIAQARLAKGEYQFALDALALAKGEVRTELLEDALATAKEGLGGPRMIQEAMGHRGRVLIVVERQRRQIQSTENQMSWFEDRARYYEEMARLLMRADREKVPMPGRDSGEWGTTPVEIALHFADRGKGRALLELTSTRRLRTADPRAGELLAQRLALDEEVHDLTARRGPLAQPGRQEEFERLTRDIEARQAHLREIEAELRCTAAGEFIEPPLLKPPEFCKSIQAGEACLEYVACEQELLVFLAAADGVQAFRVQIRRDAPAALRDGGQPSPGKLLEAYRKTPGKPESLGLEGLVCLQRDWMDRWRDRAMSPAEHVAVSLALGRAVLPAELRGALGERKVRHLTIVPSRALAFVSFASLVIGPRQGQAGPTSLADSRFLVEDYAVSYIQSLSLLDPIRRRARQRGGLGAAPGLLLAFADPVHDDLDPRTAAGATAAAGTPAPQAERDRSGADEVLRQTVRNVTIAPDASKGARWVRLGETRQEAKVIAGLFAPCKVQEEPLSRLPAPPPPAIVCAGYAANRLLARSGDLSGYRHLLFGVHGHSDAANPWLSCLMLTDLAAPPGRRQPAPLTMADVFAMDINADTVVLAACQTAMGRLRAGEGVVGFQLAFLFAGADAVVLTQWEIPSVVPAAEAGQETAYPTSIVITEFYRTLREGKLGRDESLRQAQVRVLQGDGKLRDPFYWGA